MKKTMDKQQIEYYHENISSNTPIILVHTFRDEGMALWAELQETNCPPCLLAAVKPEKWEETLSPWPAKKVFKGSSDFGSGADEHIKQLEEEIIPEIRSHTGIHEGNCFICGYSFAGLFALYSLYRTKAFAGAASVSGSLWFPGFSEYAVSHEPQRKPERLYLSLGDKESSTRKEIMKTVGEKTEALFSHYKSLGIKTIYEINPGNHFQKPEKRLAKGIRWLIQ